MGFTVAVVGATGNVGREMLTTLAERDFPADDVVALASSRSIGKEVSFGEDDVLKVQGLDTFDFRGIDIVLSSPGATERNPGRRHDEVRRETDPPVHSTLVRVLQNLLSGHAKATLERFQERGLEIVLLTQLYGKFGQETNLTEEKEVEADCKYFTEEHGLPFRVAIGKADAQPEDHGRSAEPNMQNYFLNVYPTFVVIDTNGKIVRVKVGGGTDMDAKLAAMIEPFLSAVIA